MGIMNMMNKSAWNIKERYPQSRNGYYEIAGEKIWCDMETDGGGWMLVASVSLDGEQGTRDQIGDVGNMADCDGTAKFSDEFINKLRSDSEYSGVTPWRAWATDFQPFDGNPDIAVPDRLRTQKQFINSAMTEFDATAQAIDVTGATWLHIGYEHPVCMKLKTDEKTMGFGDHYYSGDTYFTWQCSVNPNGFYAHWRKSSPGTFWVK